MLLNKFASHNSFKDVFCCIVFLYDLSGRFSNVLIYLYYHHLGIAFLPGRVNVFCIYFFSKISVVLCHPPTVGNSDDDAELGVPLTLCQSQSCIRWCSIHMVCICLVVI